MVVKAQSIEVSMDRFCKDCRYCKSYERFSVYYCKHPTINGPRNNVTGDLPSVLCRTARVKKGPCGPKGRHFERKCACDLPAPRRSFWTKIKELLLWT